MEHPSVDSSSLPLGFWPERIRQLWTFLVLVVLGNFVSVTFAFNFAVVGSLLGSVTGAIIGQETENGFLPGVLVGATLGAVLSEEAFKYSCVLWQTDIPGKACLHYIIDVMESMLNRRLVREQVVSAAMMSSFLQIETAAVETTFEEVFDIYETGETKGLSGDSVEKIPKIKITAKNNIVDTSEERICCSVCLQDIQVGMTVRALPNCHHMFHQPCIDKWLTRHASCPLCRRAL